MIRILRWILVCFLSSAAVPEDYSYKLVLNSFISGYSGGKRLVYDVLTVYFQKWANAGRCWAADQHLLRSFKRFECNRDPKHSEVHSLELWRWFTTRRAIYSSSSRCGAPYFGAASTARACSRTAMKCKAACLSVYTFKLTSYVSLCLWVV